MSSGSERSGGLPSSSDSSFGAGRGGGTWVCATFAAPRWIVGGGEGGGEGDPSERRVIRRPVDGGGVLAVAAVEEASSSSIEFLEGIVNKIILDLSRNIGRK